MALAPFGSVDLSAVNWLRTGTAPTQFSLRAGTTEIASLAWARPQGSLATGRTADGAWTFKRAGFLQPTVVARLEGRDEPVARLSAHLSRHEITLGPGPGYRLRHVSHLVPAWQLTTDRGEEILHIEPVSEGRTLTGGAVLVSHRPASPLSGLLLTLSWYFVVLTWFEDEAIEALAPFEGPDPPIARGRAPDDA